MEFQLDKFIPPLPAITRGVPIVLGADPKGVYLLYCNRTSVVLRNLKEFCNNDIFTRHAKTAKAAKYSPSRYYIASADEGGNVMIWDTVNPEHVIRNEFSVFAGPVNDLSWTSDGKRLILGGKGHSERASVRNSETGSNISSLAGISSLVNSVDIRPTAPPRAITGDSEGLVSYFEGSNYQFKLHTGKHPKGVNVVRFSPNGTFFLSAGAEGRMFVYDADTGNQLSEVGGPAHSGGIYGISFSSNGLRFVSASADKSLKLWGVEGTTITFLVSYQFPATLDYMVFGCCWVGDTITAVTFDGSIHLFDAAEDATHLNPPRAVLSGHTSPVTCALYSTGLDRLITASSDASIALWNLDDGFASRFTATNHKGGVVAMALVGDTLITVGLDDRCILSSLVDNLLLSSLNLPSQPHSVGIMARRMEIIVGCDEHIALLSAANNELRTLDVQSIALGRHRLAVSPLTGLAVVCCSNEQFVAFKVSNGKLAKTHLVNPPAQPPAVAAFSPDGSMLAFGDTTRAVTVFNIADEEDPHHLPSLQPACTAIWQKQSASLTGIAWSPNGKRIVTSSLDTTIIVWSLKSPKNSLVLKNAHPKNHCVAISWLNDSSLCGVAPDGGIRCWTVSDQ